MKSDSNDPNEIKVKKMLSEPATSGPIKLDIQPEDMERRSPLVTFLEIFRKYSMIISLIIVMLIFGVMTNGVLLAPRNISNLIFQNSYIAILAVGMLMCILTGGNIDLSVGSVVGFIGSLAGHLMIVEKYPVSVSILICLVAGIGIGIWQGFWIAYVGIPPFITTLAGMMIFRGLTLVVLNGLTLAPFPEAFLRLSTGFIPDAFGSGELNATALLVGAAAILAFLSIKIFGRMTKIRKGYETGKIIYFIINLVIISGALLLATITLAQYRGIPTVLITLAVIVVIYSVITSMTAPGRYLYALGGNEKAARLSGINTKKVMFLAYANMSFLAAVAGLVFASRLNSANPTAGQNSELDAIASCFIGGASAYGGIGTVGGVLVGAAFMGVVNNGMSILGFEQAAQQVVKGMVLLFFVALDVLTKKKSK